MPKNFSKADKQIQKYKQTKKILSKYQEFIKKNFEYVGENFAYEARSICYEGKKTLSGIYGKATKEDIKDLKGTQRIFNHRAKMCTLAAQGKWSGDLENK